MANESPSVRGFVASVIVFRGKILRSVDLWIAVAVGVAVALLVRDADLSATVNRLAAAGLGLSAALVGVVLAALAIIVAFLDDELMVLMDRATAAKHGGMEGQLFPFWFVAWLAILAVLLSVLAATLGQLFVPGVQRALVGLLSLLIVWSALGVFNLVSFIHATGVSRAILLRLGAARQDAAKTRPRGRTAPPASPQTTTADADVKQGEPGRTQG